VQNRYLPYLLSLLLLLSLVLLASGRWFHQLSLVDQVRADGELVVVLKSSPSAVQHSSTGPVGLEFDLIKAFARELGVPVRLVLADSSSEVKQALVSGKAHLGATRLSTMDQQRSGIRATEPYLFVESKLIYRFGREKPDSLESIAAKGGRIGVAKDGPHAARLRTLSEGPGSQGEPAGDAYEPYNGLEGLQWEEMDVYADELLYLVWSEELQYALVEAGELQISQQYYPELRTAFKLDNQDALVWAFPETEDSSLFNAASDFLFAIQNNGTLSQLQELYYGHLGSFDYVDVRTFLRHITNRLPRYRDIFQQAGEQHGLDWRLLAALSYQESHWDPQAVSVTGVRGLMMLTQATAGELGVDRLDPAESIEGGARYLRSMRDRLPEHIEEPVRSWFALAAYNVGLGHLEDARRLAANRDRNQDNWTDVKEHLRLLSDPAWYSKTRHGYARGWEPVAHVTKVRAYYDLLVRITELPEPNALEEELPGTRTFRELYDMTAPLGGSGESAL